MQPYESFKHRTVLLLLVTPRVPAGANSTQVVNEMTNGQCVVVNDIVTRTPRGCAKDCTAVLFSGRIITFVMKMSPLSQSHLGQLAEDPPPPTLHADREYRCFGGFSSSAELKSPHV